MDEKQAINIGIPVMYNVVFNEDECVMRACKQAKCICLSEEQVGILRKFLCDGDTLGMTLHSGNKYFINLDNVKENVPENWICDFKRDEEVFFYKNINLHNFAEWNVTISDVLSSVMGLFHMVKNIPVIYVLNMKNTITARNTLLGLCAYSETPERFMEIFFQSIICKIIGFYKRETDSSARSQFAEEIKKLFNMMNDLQKTDVKQEIFNDLCYSIDKYSEHLYKYSSSFERRIANELTGYLKKIDGMKSDQKGSQVFSIDELEKEKFGYLYQIVKKLLELEGIRTSNFPRVDTCIERDENDEYMRILHILDSIKNDVDKKEKVLSELNIAFWKGVEIPSEIIEKMEQYIIEVH